MQATVDPSPYGERDRDRDRDRERDRSSNVKESSRSSSVAERLEPLIDKGTSLLYCS
jgi:hypothetical protein